MARKSRKPPQPVTAKPSRDTVINLLNEQVSVETQKKVEVILDMRHESTAW